MDIGLDTFAKLVGRSIDEKHTSFVKKFLIPSRKHVDSGIIGPAL